MRPRDLKRNSFAIKPAANRASHRPILIKTVPNSRYQAFPAVSLCRSRARLDGPDGRTGSEAERFVVDHHLQSHPALMQDIVDAPFGPRDGTYDSGTRCVDQDKPRSMIGNSCERHTRPCWAAHHEGLLGSARASAWFRSRSARVARALWIVLPVPGLAASRARQAHLEHLDAFRGCVPPGLR